jgi:succinate dehydrogenase / fumarate reductase flavoprotein subunit
MLRRRKTDRPEGNPLSSSSRGAQARKKDPERDDENSLKHPRMARGWRPALGDRPVHLHPLSNEVPAFPPAERVY